MIKDNLTEEVSALLIRDFELEAEDAPENQQEMFDWFADYIAYLLENRLEFVFSLLYRLDVDERKVELVLRPDAPEPANIGLARLIIERQEQRVFTKKKYKQPPLADNSDLAI